MHCVPSDLDTIWKYNCIYMINYKNSNYLIINETSENVFWLCWSALWFVPSDLYIWRYRWVHHQWKLMIEVATTLWLRSIGCNIFTLDAIKLDRDIFKLSASFQMLWNQFWLNNVHGSLDKIWQIASFSKRHLRSTHGRAYPFELRMQKGDLTNPNSFKCTDDLYEEISPNLDWCLGFILILQLFQ